MKEKFRDQLMVKYPIWHEQPLRLSVSEIDNPQAVLHFFFSRYSLPAFRSCLKELLHDALCADGVDAPCHTTTHEDIEKLVEATWLIYLQNNAHKNKEKELIGHDEKSDATTQIEELTDSYKTIHDFFDSSSLPLARSYFISAVKAAESHEIWDKNSPADLLFYFESLEGLLSAVFEIEKSGHKNSKATLPLPFVAPDLARHDLYCGLNADHTPWDYFPRSLNAKEFHDPYRALKNVTKAASKKDWVRDLRDIRSYALGGSSLFDLSVEIELTKTTELIEKMLDACHLINVRIHNR